jgi:hypothetical protein
MKIVGRILVSLAGAVALVGAVVTGCSTTNNLNNGGGTSQLGETCTRTFDCADKLVCEQNVCLMPAATKAPDGGAIIPPDSGTPVGPHLGLLNESCQTSSDCQSPLACIDQSCSVVSYGLTASGKSCAECQSAKDCCELPIGAYLTPNFYLPVWYTEADGGVFLAHGAGGKTGIQANELLAQNLRCEDLLAFIGGDASICANSASFIAGDQDGLASGCFVYNTYCGSCGANGPWACTGGQCSYTAPCTTTAGGTETAALINACPTASRLRTGFSSTCASPDGGAGGTCTAGCMADTDCAGKIPSDSTHACGTPDAGGANCVCYQPTSQCYFKCGSDLDCAAGKSCDAATHLCKTQPCTTDPDCIVSLHNAMGKCTMGTCTVACTKDTDCSPPSSICSNGSCMPTGCTSDIDCTTGSAHSFCVTTPAATTTQFSSAVTN